MPVDIDAIAVSGRRRRQGCRASRAGARFELSWAPAEPPRDAW